MMHLSTIDNNYEEMVLLRYLDTCPIEKLKEYSTEEDTRIYLMNLLIPWTKGSFMSQYKKETNLGLLKTVFIVNPSKLQSLLATYSVEWLEKLLNNNIPFKQSCSIALSIYLKDPVRANFTDEHLGEFFSAAILKHNIVRGTKSGEDYRIIRKITSKTFGNFYYKDMVKDILALCELYETENFIYWHFELIGDYHSFPNYIFKPLLKGYTGSIWIVRATRRFLKMEYLDILESLNRYKKIDHDGVFDLFYSLDVPIHTMREVIKDNPVFNKWCYWKEYILRPKI